MRLKSSRLTPKRWWKNHRIRVQQTVLVLVLLIVSGGLWTYESAFRYRNELRIWFFDIGQGDSAFIETPDGHQILIDGGPDRDILTKLGQVMLPWDRTIDVVIGTHPDADHIGGLAGVLQQYEVTTIVSNGDKKSTAVAAGFFEARDSEPGATLVTGRLGNSIRFGEVLLTQLWPTEDAVEDPDTNIGSIVYRLDYHDTSVVLMGDATESVEQAIQASVGEVDVIKLGHHGSVTSSSYDFLQSAHPEEVVISCGVDNRYGHPHPAVISRLWDLGIEIYRTDKDGDLLLTSDGGDPWIHRSPLPF